MMNSVCRLMLAASHVRRPESAAALKSRWNTLRSDQGQSGRRATAGIPRTPLPCANLMNSGQVSVQRPSNPRGYQMKCPIPSEGNSSPSFQWVSPLTLPPDSFCQIFMPTARRWAPFRVTPRGGAVRAPVRSGFRITFSSVFGAGEQALRSRLAARRRQRSCMTHYNVQARVSATASRS